MFLTDDTHRLTDEHRLTDDDSDQHLASTNLNGCCRMCIWPKQAFRWLCCFCEDITCVSFVNGVFVIFFAPNCCADCSFIFCVTEFLKNFAPVLFLFKLLPQGWFSFFFQQKKKIQFIFLLNVISVPFF